MKKRGLMYDVDITIKNLFIVDENFQKSFNKIRNLKVKDTDSMNIITSYVKQFKNLAKILQTLLSIQEDWTNQVTNSQKYDLSIINKFVEYNEPKFYDIINPQLKDLSKIR